MTDTIREHADVVFPAEAYPEKEGTLVHPDGRVQRLRPAIGRARGRSMTPGSGVRALWQVIAEVSKRAGYDPGVMTGAAASKLLFDGVPFYEGLTLDEIGGRGVRWFDRAEFVSPAWELATLDVPAARPAAKEGALRLGTFRPLWAHKDVEVSPALHFMRARQVAELSPLDASALGINEGDVVEVAGPAGRNGDGAASAATWADGRGTRVRAGVRLREAIPAGTVFLAEATREDTVNVLTEPLVELRRVGVRPAHEPSAVAALIDPAAERAEMPASAPMEIPPVSGGHTTSGGSGGPSEEGRG
jgi:NADH-quinone oxidoreductase subunit G